MVCSPLGGGAIGSPPVSPTRLNPLFLPRSFHVR
jgi:hypothetical protein